ncbi:hypothetical protein GCM10023213_39290 [Prosthecobacter algae]|uniref:Uncharacterized protein n=1 Tax=Prosthecobacter algae TaxID=1144682 RepID=A0ABP9PGW2_9BACT
MIQEDLAAQQLQGAAQALSALVRHCRDVYVRAATLLDVQSEELAFLRSLGVVESINLTPLAPAYHKLCARYRTTLNDGQTNLFPSAQKTTEEIWWAWYYHELTPQLLGSAHFIRTVLRSLGLLHCPDPSIARIELEAFIDNLPLHNSYFHPTWPAPL